MGTAVLVLLCALAALAVGVLLGRYYVPDDRNLRRTARHAGSYMRALNHILARDHDSAVDELKAVVREDVHDVEPYFALGALFRSRGEWERAIRVHQAIELRADRNPRMALRARYELGIDFRAAGMPRRATRAMEECVVEDREHEGALRALCGLYEDEGRYEEAAAAWGRLAKADKMVDAERRVHLLAAAAEQYAVEGDLAAARRMLKRAEKLDPKNPHVVVASAQLARSEGQGGRAQDLLIQALVDNPELAGFLVPSLCRLELEDTDATRAGVGDAESDWSDSRPEFRRTLAALDRAVNEAGNVPLLLLARGELRQRLGDTKRAGRDYEVAFEADEKLLPARIAAARQALADEDPDSIADQLRSLVSEGGPLGSVVEGRWRCTHCGDTQTTFGWRCGTCHQWATMARDIAGMAFRQGRRDRRRGPRPVARSPLVGAEPGTEEQTLFGRATSVITGVFKKTSPGGPGVDSR